MSYTIRQMLELATSFWLPSNLEIMAKMKNKKKYYIVKMSDSEVLTATLDVLPISNNIPQEARFTTLEQAFAVANAFAAVKTND
jgi:hypothetical protein